MKEKLYKVKVVQPRASFYTYIGARHPREVLDVFAEIWPEYSLGGMEDVGVVHLKGEDT